MTEAEVEVEGQELAGEMQSGVGRVQLHFVESPIVVEVDMALLTWGDLLDIQRMQRQAGQGAAEDAEGAVERASDLLSDLVSKITGQDARLLPSMAVTQILASIRERAAGTQAKN